MKKSKKVKGSMVLTNSTAVQHLKPLSMRYAGPTPKAPSRKLKVAR